MPQRTLRFKIRQDGRVEETVEGLVGEACIDLTEKLEDALGTVERRERTSDTFLSENVQKQTIPAEIHSCHISAQLKLNFVRKSSLNRLL